MSIHTRKEAEALAASVVQLVANVDRLAKANQRMKEDHMFSSDCREFTDDECKLVREEMFNGFRALGAIDLIMKGYKS